MFKALLVSSARYPCSSKDGGVSGRCGGAYSSDWPLQPGTPYYKPNGTDLFNTVNVNGVFDGSVTTLDDVTGLPSIDGAFVSGVNSVLTNANASDLAGWAYDDMNSALDAKNYADNNNNCNQWTSASHQSYGSYGVSGSPIDIHWTIPPSSTWGNYYYFADSGIYSDSYYVNVWIGSDFVTCDRLAAIVCVG